MNNTIEVLPPAAPRSAPGILLHCGAEPVARTSLNQVRTPSGTDSWYPLPHADLLGEVLGQLDSAGFRLVGETHALTHEGARYFGVLEITLPDRATDTDYGWIVGLRNSHDKVFPAGLVAGSRCFVCDNLAFSGEVRISRKHTKNARRDLRHLTARAVGQLGDRFLALDQRIGLYKSEPMPDWSAHDLVIRAMDCRAITPSQVPAVLQEWRKPQYDAFLPRNLWSLFNAFTEAYKRQNPATTIRRSQALHGLCDSIVGIN